MSEPARKLEAVEPADSSSLESYRKRVAAAVDVISESMTKAFFGDYTCPVKTPSDTPEEIHLLGMLTNSLINAVRNSLDREAKKNIEYKQAILRCLGEGVVGIDKDDRITFINPKGEELLGWSEAELLGKNFSDTLYGRSELGRTAMTPTQAVILSGANQHHLAIHLLLTDVIMPRMNGRELAQKILAIQPDIRVLYCSGYTKDVMMHQGILQDEVDFIQKPFRQEVLLTRVRKALSKKK